MTVQLITLKLEKSFLKDIDRLVKEGHYHNRTEFIRETLRNGINQKRANEFLRHLESWRGKAKHQ